MEKSSRELRKIIRELGGEISKLKEDIGSLKARKPPSVGLIYGSLGVAIAAIIVAGITLARRT